MGKVTRYIKSNLFLYLSFFIPVLIYGIVMVLFRIYPFGERTLLVLDMNNQYIDYYAYLYDVFEEGRSLLYSWEAGLGLNFIGILAYYLSSPLSFLILFFDRTHLPEAMVLITLVKVGIAGVTSNIYLSQTFPRRNNKYETFVFSVMYALMAYSIVYSSNIMWLDAVLMLPLVLLGIEKMLVHNKGMLFVVTLTVTFISNFYTSYMVGIFSFLYFLARLISTIQTRSIKTYIKYCLKFAGYTFLSIGLSAFIIVPLYKVLQSSPNDISPIFSFDLNYNIVDIYLKLFNSTYDSLRNGTPNIYVGIPVLLLSPLFFISKNIRKKEKVIFSLFLLFLVFSFVNPTLNIFWHAFDAPNWFPFRYSFIFTFLILYFAYRIFIELDESLLPKLNRVYVINLILIVILQKISPQSISIKQLFINMIFLSIFTIIFYMKVRWANRIKWVNFLLVLFICLDLGTNIWTTYNAIDREFKYVTKQQYLALGPKYTNMINYVNTNDNDFFRMESTVRRKFNDSFRFNYKGVSHFSSLPNGQLHKFLQNIGYTTLGNFLWVSNSGSTLVTDALFSMKYMISNKTLNKHGFIEYKQDEDYVVYKNENVLPLAFMMNHYSGQHIEDSTDPFVKQNKLLGPIGTSGKDNYFKPLSPRSINYVNVLPTRKGVLEKENKKNVAYVEYIFDVNGKKQFYTLFNNVKFNSVEVAVNDKNRIFYPNVYDNRILDLGSFQSEEVNVKIYLKNDNISYQDLLFYVLDIPLFEERISELKQQSISISRYNDMEVQGAIEVINSGILFFSIPYDGGWKATVDGKHAKILKIYDSFIGIDIEEGNHTVKLKFTPLGLKTGIIVSIISLLFLIVLVITKRIK